MSKLFPKEIINNSAEENFSKHNVTTKLLYLTITIFVVSCIIMLPFIHIGISVNSTGIIQPLSNRNQVISLVTGKIQKLFIHENVLVTRGEKIAIISSPELHEKLSFNRFRGKKLTHYISDLNLLQHTDSSSLFKPLDLRTAKYQRFLIQFRQSLKTKIDRYTQANRKVKRLNKLHKKGFVSDSKFENAIYELQKARSNFNLFFDQQINTWQSDKIAYQKELDQLESEQKQLEKKINQYSILAPVSGTIQNMKGLYEGSSIHANQVLAQISPDTSLIAECYVTPKNVGLIKKGMKTHMIISAFDYNQWGILNGTVKEISNDVTIVGNNPVFIVKVSLDKDYLELKNGYKGKLKKGMTLQARFMITHQSLFQLLYNNVNDWLNPKWDHNKLSIKNLN